MFDVEDYDYDLPPKLIAQVPAESRDSSRLLVVDRSKKTFYEHRFFELPRLLGQGDLLVLNNTRVIPARLFGRKESGGRVEILVLESTDPKEGRANTRWCLLRSSKRPKQGSLLLFESDVAGVVQESGENGLVRITFKGERSIDHLIEEKGHMPLPPYIKRHAGDAYRDLDRERYQTVFSVCKGAVAAPTAGLHFTEDLFQGLKRTGVLVSLLTLHVGYGTFLPVRTRDIREHRLGEEIYRIDSGTATAIRRAKEEGRRVIAVGTTVVRALETAFDPEGWVRVGEGKTNLLVTPGFQFNVVDGLITNFHLPRSSLLFLVAAFAGPDLTREAYALAVGKEYRFYSYGDAMLIL